jgi:6-phosphogluconate dehydrogenase
VISSWLLDLSAIALAKDAELSAFLDTSTTSGRSAGPSRLRSRRPHRRGAVSSLYARFRSRKEHTFGEKLLSAMRFGFGGHVEGDVPTDPTRR